jgi:hypothetical protein
MICNRRFDITARASVRMTRPDGRVCPFHADEFIRPEFIGSETADYEYTCVRVDHPAPGPYSWPFVPEPVGLAGDSLGLGLDVELPSAVQRALAASGQSWVEYGLVEQAYAAANPRDWGVLLAKYGHTHYQPADATRAEFPYTASKYLARSLGALSSRGSLAHKFGAGTGRCNYLKSVSYYGLPNASDWEDRATWAASGLDMSTYMPVERPR